MDLIGRIGRTSTVAARSGRCVCPGSRVRSGRLREGAAQNHCESSRLTSSNVCSIMIECPPAAHSPRSTRPSAVEQLRERVAAMSASLPRSPVATLPGLAEPGAAARRVLTYAVDSASLALAPRPQEPRRWGELGSGSPGAPTSGRRAAAELGIESVRTVLVPDPGEHWLEVTAALVEFLRVVGRRLARLRRRAHRRHPRLAPAHALGRARRARRLAPGRGPPQHRGVEPGAARRPALGHLQQRHARVALRRGRTTAAARGADVARGAPGRDRRRPPGAGDPDGVGGEGPMRVMVLWCPLVGRWPRSTRRRSPAAVLSANVVDVCNGRPVRGRRPPGRPGPVPRPGRRRPPTPTAMPGLRAPSWPPSRTCVPGSAAPGLLAVRGTRQLVRHRERRCRHDVPGRGGGRRLVRLGIAHVFTAERAARTADVQSWVVVPEGGSACRCTCCRTTVRDSWSVCSSGSASAPSATWPTSRRRPSSTGWAPTAPPYGERRGTRPRSPHAPTAESACGRGIRAAPRLRRDRSPSRVHHRRAVRLPAGPHQLVATAGAGGRGRVRGRRLLVPRRVAPRPLHRPRPGRPGALAAAVGRRRRLAAGAQALRCARPSTGSGSFRRWWSPRPPTARRCGWRGR